MEDLVKEPVADWATDFDHSHPDYGANAPAIWDELRTTCPVAHSERFGGMWLPTRHDDIAAIAANDDGNYTSQRVVVSAVEDESMPAPIGGAPPITSDPPFHADARRLLLAPFAPKVINEITPFARQFCNDLLDDALAKAQANDGVFDAAVDYAQSIPVRVIAKMLGLPPEDGDIFRRFIHQIVENPVDHDVADEDSIEVYLDAQIDKHKADPKPEGDLIDHLLRVELYGEKLSDEHVRGTVILLLIAGIDTTWSAIGSSLWHLAQNPDDLKRYRDEPEIRPFAQEEFLRFYAPVTMARLVAQDHELRGCPMKQGDWVLLPFPAANRDPEAFDDADTFIIDRQKNRHGAFGLGIHRCLGSNLARMELAVALDVFVERIDEFELVDPEAVRFSTGQIRGPRELPIRVTR